MEITILQPDSHPIDVDDIQSLNVQTIDGEITILPNHISIITALDIGIANIQSSTSGSKYTIHGGFLEILGNKIVILANACESSEDIIVERAEHAKKRAEERISGKSLHTDEEIDLVRANQSLRRAEARLKIISAKIK